MKHALKASFLIVLGAVLLAALHSHRREHQVPHPHAAKVSAAKHVVPQPQLPVAHATVAVLGAEHPIAIGFIATSGAVALIETEQSSCWVRGPPLVCPLYVR